MFNSSKKYICLLTAILLLSYSILSVLPLPWLTPRARAASLERDDFYRGLALALLLITLSRIGQAARDHGYVEPPGLPELPDLSENEFELLARVIHAEARGEPYNGQVAVGAVVLNRVRSADFPNSIRDVVYQKKQFSSVDDGQIHLEPNETSYRAAREALRGVDPSKGALFFYNPRTATTLWWLSQRETTVIIGNHVFAR